MFRTLKLSGRKYDLAFVYDLFDFKPDYSSLQEFPDATTLRCFFGNALVKPKDKNCYDLARRFKTNKVPLHPQDKIDLETLVFTPIARQLIEQGGLRPSSEGKIKLTSTLTAKSYRMNVVDLLSEKLYELQEADNNNLEKVLPRLSVFEVVKKRGYLLTQRVVDKNGVKHTYICLVGSEFAIPNIAS